MLKHSFISLFICGQLTFWHSQGLCGVTTELNGVVLKSSAYEYAPHFVTSKTSSGNSTYSGLVPEILQFLSDYYNLKIQFVPVDPNEVTKYGITLSLIRQIDKKLVDLAGYPFEVSLFTMEHMDVTHPVWMSGFRLLQLYPSEQSRLQLITRPFSYPVWICFFLAVALFVVFTSLLMENQSNNDIQFIRILSQMKIERIYIQFEYVLTIALLQGNQTPYNATMTVKVATGAFLISMIVLVNGYVSVLASILTVPKLEPIINNLDELAASSVFRLTLEKGSLVADIIMNATDGIEYANGNALRRDPSLFYPNPLEMIQNVLNRNTISIVTDDLGKYIVKETQTRKGECRLTISTKPMQKIFMTWQFGLVKGSLYSNFFSTMAIRCWDHGFITYWKAKYLPTNQACRIDVPPQTQMKALSMSHLSVSFLILGFGVAMSTSAFLLEKIYNIVQHINKNPKP